MLLSQHAHVRGALQLAVALAASLWAAPAEALKVQVLTSGFGSRSTLEECKRDATTIGVAFGGEDNTNRKSPHGCYISYKDQKVYWNGKMAGSCTAQLACLFSDTDTDVTEAITKLAASSTCPDAKTMGCSLDDAKLTHARSVPSWDSHAWGPAQAKQGEWIEATLDRVVTLTHITLQGKYGGKYWGYVKTFKLLYSKQEASGGALATAKNDQGGNVFRGPDSQMHAAIATRAIQGKGVAAQRIRVEIVSWANYPSLRFALTGHMSTGCWSAAYVGKFLGGHPNRDSQNYKIRGDAEAGKKSGNIFPGGYFS